jgi:hypothetical protein
LLLLAACILLHFRARLPQLLPVVVFQLLPLLDAPLRTLPWAEGAGRGP